MFSATRLTPRLRFRAALTIVISACAIAPAGSTIAQTLELTRPIAPPALPSPTLLASMVKTLEQEASDLAAQAGGVEREDERAALRARAALRRLAAELLAMGDRRGHHDAGIIAIKGLKLAAGRDALDQAIAHALDSSGSDVDDALEAFSRAYSDHVQGGAPSDAGVDQWCASLMSRLLPVVVNDGAPPRSSHWAEDRRGATTSPSGATSQPHDPDDDDAEMLRTLHQRTDTSSLDEQTRTTLSSILDFLARGRHFAELRPRVRQYAQTISNLLDCDQAIAAANWLEESAREPMRDSLAQAIAWFGDPEKRSQGLAEAQRLDLLRRTLTAATFLQSERVDARPLRSAVIAAQKATEQAGASPPDAGRHYAQLLAVLERMVAYRELPASTLARDLRIAEREVAKTYRDSEQKVLKEIAAGALVERSMADPALASLLADHRGRLEDLQRLRRMPAWSAAIAQIYPPASKDFDAQVKRWTLALLEPSRRPQAILTMQRFEQELARFERLPFEDDLRQARPEAIELTAGQHEQVLAIVIAKRRAWADDWSRVQQTPEPAKTMDLLHRFMQSMRDSAALTRLDPGMLNRWPAWQVSAALVERGQRDIITRLKLASAALLQGDHALLESQLERVASDAPLGRLAGRLAHALGDDLAERQNDAAGVLAQLVHEPPSPPRHARFIEHRRDLADLCRYVAESEHARQTGQREVAEEVDRYARDLVTRLLSAIE